MGVTKRHFLIATGVTTGLQRTAGDIVRSVDRMAQLFIDTFGYTRMEGLGIDPEAQAMRRELRRFCKSRRPDDLVVLYHTGHADLVHDRQHRLWMGDTEDDLADTISTSDLAELMLSGTPLQQALIIIDTCHAGAGGAEAMLAAMRAMGPDDKTLAVITAAHPVEQIRAGEFARLFADAVNGLASGGYTPSHLAIGSVVGCINNDPSRKPSQTVAHSVLLDRSDEAPFFPNPRHNPALNGLDLFTQYRLEQRELRVQDLLGHFLPRARGVELPTEQAWRFQGRRSALTELVSWLGNSNDHRARIVTGHPGSGKSALIGRLVVLSDPDWRRSVPLEGVAEPSVPECGAIGAAIHARGLTGAEVLESICAAVGIAPTSVEKLVQTAAGRPGLVVVVDAVDEAVDPARLADLVLRPIMDSSDVNGIRLLLGTRRHLLATLGSSAEVIDLDGDHADPASLKQYSECVLVEAHPLSPYRFADPGLVGAVAEAVAQAAGHSFLVALILSRTLASLPGLPDPADLRWRAALPGSAAEAMRHDLEMRLGLDAKRARELLTPLAFSHGAGFPWEDLWAPLAARLSGYPYSDADLVWLRKTAGAYVVETVDAGRSVYRLYHMALAEYLRQSCDEMQVRARFLAFLLDRVPRGEGGALDWARAHPYIRAHLATHAVDTGGGAIDSLLTDPGYLVSAAPTAVLAALPHVRWAQGAAAAYQRALHHLRSKTRSEHLSYLELAAHRAGATELARRCAETSGQRNWSALWAQWPAEHPHRVLSGHTGPVTDVRCIEGSEATTEAVTVGLDATIRRWNLLTCEPVAEYEFGVQALSAMIDSSARRAVVLEDSCNFSVWDLGTGKRLVRVASAAISRGLFDLWRVLSPRIDLLNLPAGEAVITAGRGLRPAVWDLETGAKRAKLPSRVRRGRIESLQLTSERAALRWSEEHGHDPELWDPESGRTLPSAWARKRWLARIKYFGLPDGPPLIAVIIGRFSITTSAGFWELATDRLLWRQSLRKPGEHVLTDGRRLKLMVRVPQEGHETRSLDRWSQLRLTDDAVVSQEERKAAEREAILLLDEVELVDLSQPQRSPRQAQNTLQLDDVRLSGHTDVVTAFDRGVLPGGRRIVVTSSRDGTARLWELDEQEPGESSGNYAVGTSVIAYRRSDGWQGLVHLQDQFEDSVFASWHLDSGKRGTPFWLRTLASCHTLVGDSVLLTFGIDHDGMLHNLASGEFVAWFYADPANWPVAAAAAEVPGVTTLAVTGGHESRALVWDIRTGQLKKILKGHSSRVGAVATGRTPDGTVVAVLGGDDFRLTVWDLARLGRRSSTRLLRPWQWIKRVWSHRVGIDHVAIGVHQGESLIAVLVGDQIRLLRGRADGTRYRQVGVIPGAVAFDLTERDGTCWVIVATAGKQVEAWEPTGSEPTVRIDVEADIHDIAATPAGHVFLATANGLATLGLLRIGLAQSSATSSR
ncbi:hypothetical protein ACIBH1_36240 [Nonomuraea sp. NPDC050663]|uniref:hypothetical protein n=1 Tax=Nonomuraea sp. NPDC050663 TaxID=3364370 RepID=UPI0037BA6FC5